ncbi:MAG: VOC family protein [Acidimicrobiales bacterium]
MVGLVAIDHVQLAMPAGAEAEAVAMGFYGGVLSLERVPKPAALAVRGGAWFRSSAGVNVHLGAEADFRPARKAHPAFVVEGFDEICARAASAGATLVPADGVPGVRRVHVDDPFGNCLELIDGGAS